MRTLAGIFLARTAPDPGFLQEFPTRSRVKPGTGATQTHAPDLIRGLDPNNFKVSIQ